MSREGKLTKQLEVRRQKKIPKEDKEIKKTITITICKEAKKKNKKREWEEQNLLSK